MLRTPSEIFWYGFYSLIRYNTKQIRTKNHQPGFPGGWNYPPMPYFWTYMPLWGRLLLCSLDPSKELQLLRLSKLKQIMVQKRKSWGNKVTLISWTMIIERMKSLPMLILKTKLSSLTTLLILEICIIVAIMAFWLKTLWSCCSFAKAWHMDFKNKKAERKTNSRGCSKDGGKYGILKQILYFSQQRRSGKTDPQTGKEGRDLAVQLSNWKSRDNFH